MTTEAENLCGQRDWSIKQIILNVPEERSRHKAAGSRGPWPSDPRAWPLGDHRSPKVPAARALSTALPPASLPSALCCLRDHSSQDSRSLGFTVSPCWARSVPEGRAAASTWHRCVNCHVPRAGRDPPPGGCTPRLGED